VKVYWTETAVENLSAIYTYIAQTSTQYASRLVDRITRRSEQIASFPLSGRIVSDLYDFFVKNRGVQIPDFFKKSGI
jgi:toxin ParE1/3/4